MSWVGTSPPSCSARWPGPGWPTPCSSGRSSNSPAKQRSAGHLWLAEAVATGVLILLVFGLLRAGHGGWAPVAVAGWIGAACWGTSSGSFANPALTVGRALSDSYTGIAPGSVPAFVLAQCVGAAAGLALVAVLFGRSRDRVPDDARELLVR
ncbi:aquaporin [Kitasatospora gansuensis]